MNIHRYVNGRKKPKGHVTIQLETAKQLLPKSVSTIPGQKVCNQCWKDIQMMLRDTAENQSMPLSDESSETFDYSDTEENECSLNVSLQSCGVSPFKSKGLRATQRSVHADKKIDKVTANLRSAFESKGIAIPPKPSNCDVNYCDSNSAAKDDLDALMQALKIKYADASSFADKVCLLTLKPDSWTINQTVDFFQNGTTKHMVRTAKKLKGTSGLLSRPIRKTRMDKIKAETLQAVKDFFTMMKIPGSCQEKKTM